MTHLKTRVANLVAASTAPGTHFDECDAHCPDRGVLIGLDAEVSESRSHESRSFRSWSPLEDDMTPPLLRRCSAEFLGTLWLVFGGCGSAVLAAAFPNVGIGLLGVSLAFGLTVLTMAYAIGHISGCHLNPAVSIGLWAGKRFPGRDLAPYIVAQVIGGIAGAAILFVIASGKAGFDTSGGFAANGFGEHSPGGYSLAGLSGRRSRPHVYVPHHHPRRHGRTRAERVRADRDWPRADA